MTEESQDTAAKPVGTGGAAGSVGPGGQAEQGPPGEQEGPSIESIAAVIENDHPADAADKLEDLDIGDQVRVIEHLARPEAAMLITEMERHDRSELMRNLQPRMAAELLSEMPLDDAADVLSEVEPEHKNVLLQWLGKEDAAELRTLLAFDPETAGGVMNTEVVVLDEKLTADQAIMLIRQEALDKEIPYYAYLVDEEDHLTGVLSMRDLLLAKPGRMLRELVTSQSLVSVTFDVDKEEVAHLIGHYNFLALPVVDYEDHLLGVVTVDDVIDIIHEEATEDMQTMVGAASDETVDSPWRYSVKKRLPWLVVNVINSAISAFVVHLFEGNIAQMAILAVLMPIVANQAGNTGQQALAVMIRQLAMEKFDRKRSWAAVLREGKIGLVNGLFVSVVVFAAVYALTREPALSGIMSLALLADMLIGALAGASIPLVLKELGRDPAQASSIFLTTLTDSFGFFSLLGLAGLFLLR